MAAKNDMFELLVKITGDSSVATKTLDDLKKEVKDLDAQMRKADLGSSAFENLQMKVTGLRAAISGLERPTDAFVKSGKTAGNVALNLNRVVQDMPYGIMGIANNVDQLQESWVRLKEEQGGVKAGFSALIGAMTGPAGIMMAVSAVMALVVAFGDDLVGAIMGAGDEVDKMIDRLDTVQEYTPIDIAIQIRGMEGIERIKAEMDLLIARKDYLEGLTSRREMMGAAAPSFGERVVGFFGGSLGAQATYAEQRSLQSQFDAEDKKLADRIASGELTIGVKEDLRLMQEYLDMSEVAARETYELNRVKLDMRYNEIEQAEQERKDAEEAKKKIEQESKRALAERKKVEREREKLLRMQEKEAAEIAKAQESLYSSMLSNVESMVIDDLADLEIAMQGLQAKPIQDRYASLLAKIDETIPQITDKLIRSELEAVRKKLLTGGKLTSGNVSFLEAQGGLSAYDAGFLGRYTSAQSRVSKKTDDLEPLSKQWSTSIEDIGENFSNTASQAFQQSVSLFSAQLAAAIFQGGQSFSQILTNVANTFGQMLMQFIIEAFAQQVASGLLGFLGLAEGALYAPPGYTWVGEKGPEIVRMNGGEEVVPNNQVSRRLNDLYSAGFAASDMSGLDVSGIVAALNKQTRALLKDRLNYEITDKGSRQIARATKARSNQISRYTGG